MAKSKKDPKPLSKRERRERRKARRHAKAEGRKWNCERWLVTFRRLRNGKKVA